MSRSSSLPIDLSVGESNSGWRLNWLMVCKRAAGDFALFSGVSVGFGMGSVWALYDTFE
jgi:hypothetical protein